MNRGGIVVLAALLFAAEAHAGSIKLVSGGPESVDDKRDVVRTLIRAGGKLSRCMRGRKKALRIKASVRRNGRVRWARGPKRSRAGHCVARVIRRQRFGRQRHAWTMVVELSTGAPASAARRDMNQLRRNLAPVRDTINRCARRYGAAGRAQLSFVVAASGRLTRVAIKASASVSSRARTCMLRAIQGADVGAAPGAVPVPFRLSFGFAHRPGPSGNHKAARGPQPKKFGALKASAIAPVMDKKAKQFQRCYRRYRKPGLSGDVVLRFTVRKNGTVRNVKIRKTTLKHKRIERCIVAVGKTLRFPKAYGTTRVFYPFRF